VLLFNATNTAATISTTATAAGLPKGRAFQMDNLWTNAVTQTGGAISAFVPGHGVAMFTVTTVGKRRRHNVPPHTVLSLEAASPQVGVGGSTTVSESFTNAGVSDVKTLRLSLAARPGWQVKPLGRAGAALLKPGQRFTVAYRVTAPRSGPPLTFSIFTGGASYDPLDGRRTSLARLGELVSSPVHAPLSTADVTADAASFGASGRALAISARGLGVFSPPFGAPPTDSYAAIFKRAGCRRSCIAQVTVTADPAGGTSGGAGLIERDDMTAGKHSRAGVVLFVSSNATIVMAWNGSGGADVDQYVAVPSVTVRAPVRLRLVRRDSAYAGYYSTNRGKTWNPVGTVTVAASASGGRQDVGVFHASGLNTWTTTATFRDFRVR
jgi:alpha-galactosidase